MPLKPNQAFRSIPKAYSTLRLFTGLEAAGLMPRSVSCQRCVVDIKRRHAPPPVKHV